MPSRRHHRFVSSLVRATALALLLAAPVAAGVGPVLAETRTDGEPSPDPNTPDRPDSKPSERHEQFGGNGGGPRDWINPALYTPPAPPPVVQPVVVAPPAPAPRPARPDPAPRPKPVVTLPQAGQGFVPDQVVLTLRGGLADAALARLLVRHGLQAVETRRASLAGVVVVKARIADGRSVAAALAALRGEGRLAFAQPNYVYSLSLAANAAGQYVVKTMELEALHRTATGKGVTVGVIDSGVDDGHPALVGALIGQYDALADAGGTEPAHDHGTAMTGAIAARTDLEAIAPDAQVLAARAFAGKAQAAGQGTSFDVVESLDWAVAKGARVVNMSFAGPKDALLARSIARATAQGVICIAAAGNEGPGAAPAYPGADPNVIAVTASDDQGRLYARANRGGYVAVAAPGVDILVAAPGGTYTLTTGTSVAAAHVSGVVAMMLEKNPRLRTADVRKLLTTTATEAGAPGPDPEFGAGIVNAVKAIDAAQAARVATAN